MQSLIVLLAVLLVGCAQPVLEIADPREHHRTAVKTVLESGHFKQPGSRQARNVARRQPGAAPGSQCGLAGLSGSEATD